MKSDDFLAELVELDTFPADFDPYFFNEIAGRFFVSDPTFEISQLVDFVVANESAKQPTILWSVILAVLKRIEGENDVVTELFNKWNEHWLELAVNCPCMLKILFELSTQLVNKKSVDVEHAKELSLKAVELVLAERTNVELRRCLAVFLSSSMSNYPDLDSVVVKPLIHGFHETDQSMVIDAISSALSSSSYLQRMTDAEKLAIHERLKGMTRPGLAYLMLAAKVYQTVPDKIASCLSEPFASDKIPSLVAYEVLALDDPNISKEMLLKTIALHTSETVDNLVDCLEDYEEAFPNDTERVRREIISSIPNPRHCSAQSLTKFFNHLRLDDGVTGKNFLQAFVTAKSRIQREPDLLDAFMVDTDDLAALMQEPTVQKIFNELTIDVIMVEHSFNWLHTDSAISILDRIADYFHYDEDQTHDRISKLVEDNDDELGYVALSASKFLFNHAPEYVIGMADNLFVLNPNAELRMIILNRLILCSPTELPSKKALNQILDDVIQLESNEELQLKALILVEKLHAANPDYESRHNELMKLVKDQELLRQCEKGFNEEELVQMVESAKIHSDCYNHEVSKECY